MCSEYSHHKQVLRADSQPDPELCLCPLGDPQERQSQEADRTVGDGVEHHG